MMNRRIVLLCSACFPTTVLHNFINKEFPIEHVIEEKPMRGLTLAKKRFKKFGFFSVSGQIAFSFGVVPFLKLAGKGRVKQLKQQYAFDDTPIPAEKIKHVETVNDDACIDLLRQYNPAIVLVSGTRIISKKILDACPAMFINMHAGITPVYRGVHGGYWAVANNDIENFGVTVHQVDKGIDTGEVLYQEKIKPTSKDNYVTYPYLQLGEGLPLMKKAVQDYFASSLKPLKPSGGQSRLWYHPTVWQFLYYKFRKKKKRLHGAG